MVSEEGQLYTIEGVAASILILTTVYLVLSTTTIFTPGESHIYDMQLEQLGNDALAVLDTSPTWSDPYPKSSLELSLEDISKAPEFNTTFLELINSGIGQKPDSIKYNATVISRDSSTGELVRIPYSGSIYHRENAVKVFRWVNIDNTAANGAAKDTENQTVLFEVLLWRG